MAVTYAYSDPTNYIEENKDRHGYQQTVMHPNGYIQWFQGIFSQKRYITNSTWKKDAIISATHELVSYPNPKRGYLAITTYPPVYKTLGAGGTRIVVPRKYPPIFIDYYRRNR